MKKQILILSIAALSLSLTACSKSDDTEAMEETTKADSEIGVTVNQQQEDAQIGVEVLPAEE